MHAPVPPPIESPVGTSSTRPDGRSDSAASGAIGVDSILAQAVDEFTDRVNRGESPDPAEFAARFPAAAPILLDILPALLAVWAGPAAPAPPAQVGGYVLARELGRGGMGRVYLAVHAALKRTAAVKLVTEERAAPKDLIRFLAEAEAVAAVSHPNVVQVYEYGEDAGRPFLVLELLPGGTLADKMAAGPLAPVEAAGLVAAIARGVAAAHALGIVHRDLKPANVLFDSVGVPKVTDFGLAKRRDSDLTATRAVLGTPSYMAPEQAGGRAKFVGPPADVWSLGVILYESVTGRRPFAGDDVWAVIAAVQSHEPPSTRTLAAAVPRDLDLIVRKCLDKSPAGRYPTAGELADDLDRLLSGKPVTVRPVRAHERAWKWARRNRAVAALMFAVFVSLTAGLAAALTYAARERNANGVAAGRLTDLESANATLTTRAQILDLSNKAVFDIFEGIDPDDPQSTGRPLRAELGARLAAAGTLLDGVAGDDPTSVTMMRQRLAKSLFKLGQYEAAARQFEQLRRELTAARGADHEDVLNVLGDLGSVYRRWEKPEDAARIQGEVARIRRAKAGPDDEDALIAVSLHGSALSDAGRPDEAIRTLEDCHRRFAVKFPADNRNRLIAASHLALAYTRGGRSADALRMSEALVPDITRVFGPTHIATLHALNNQGVAYHVAGKFADAARVLEPLLPRLDRHYEDPNHPAVLELVETLASAYQDAGRFADAANLYDRLATAFRKSRPEADGIRINSIAQLGMTRVQAGQFAAAEVPLREVLAVREKLTPERWSVANLQSVLGESLLGQQKFRDAEPLLVAGYKGLRERTIPPAARPCEKLANARERLAKLYDMTNRPAEAAALRAAKPD